MTGSVCYDKSAGGLWVRATVYDDLVVLEHAVRHVVDGGVVTQIGHDGSTIGVDAGRSVDRRWIEFGRICGDRWRSDVWHDGLLAGVARVVLRLVCLGFGETPGEVAGWFSSIDSVDTDVCCAYRIMNGVGPLSGLDGELVVLGNSSSLVIGDGYEIDVTGTDGLIESVMLCTIPEVFYDAR